MAGNSDACHRTAREVFVREIEVVIPRVVMVGEMPGHHFDAHLLAAISVEHAPRHPCCALATRRHPRPRFIGAVDIRLRSQAQHQRNHNHREVQRVDSIPVPHAITVIEGHSELLYAACKRICISTDALAYTPKKRPEAPANRSTADMQVKPCVGPSTYSSSMCPSFTVRPMLPAKRSSSCDPTSSKRQPSRRGLRSGWST